MAKWFQTGYESATDAYESAGGDDAAFTKRETRRHWQPPNTTNRLLFLDDDPFVFFEHKMCINGSWKNFEPCKVRNKMEEECAVCDHNESTTKKSYPKFTGLHTIINMTPWTSKKGNVYNYAREIFPALMGTEKRGGVLRKLARLKKQHGRLRGLVFDVERSGEQSEGCGDDFILVHELDPDAIDAARDKAMAKFVGEVNANLPASKQVKVETLLKYNPWEPIDFEEEIAPRTNAQLRKLLSGGNDRDHGGGDGESSSDYADDDIPF